MSRIFSTRFAKDLYRECQEDKIFNSAAALAYYWMLSIFPAAIFLLSLLPYLPIPHLAEAIMHLLKQMLPGQAADLFTNVVQNVVSQKSGGVLSFGVLFSIWSASNGLYAIMQQLNTTYDLRETRPFWKVRGTALMLMLLFLTLIIGAFALVVFGGVMQNWLAGLVGQNRVLLTFFSVFRWAVIICLLLLGLTLIYYFGPDTDHRLKLVSVGSVAGIGILIAASLAFQFYITNFSNYSATYGSLGAVIILLLWFYVAGLAILIGSEINALLEQYKAETRNADKTGTRQGN